MYYAEEAKYRYLRECIDEKQRRGVETSIIRKTLSLVIKEKKLWDFVLLYSMVHSVSHPDVF